ncbi:serine hydrolase [Streptomyces sp. NPDC003077]|uniref:D-alanyl-D-alanine carboxypeptidase family protein n=1 Tax=Streptomyces sp. NPDC003077 TaxID=3154443 RepID=UPI0033B310F8
MTAGESAGAVAEDADDEDTDEDTDAGEGAGEAAAGSDPKAVAEDGPEEATAAKPSGPVVAAPDAREEADGKGTRDAQDAGDEDATAARDVQDAEDRENPKDPKDTKDTKDATATEDPKDATATRDVREKDEKNTNDEKNTKDEPQDVKATPTPRAAQDPVPVPVPVPPDSPPDPLVEPTVTPPPPPTPALVRRRGVVIGTAAVALLVLVVLAVQLLRPLPEPTLAIEKGASSFTIGGAPFTMPWPDEGQGAVMVVGSGGVGTFGEQKPVPTASVAKIMTAYVILRDHPLKKDEPGPRIAVDARTVEEGKAADESRIEGLRVGQTFSLQDMLKMLMIPSGNNVARLLARWDTGTQDETAFVRKMNAAAKSLGMENTTYTDPSGLDKGTVSTAVDQLKLAEAAMRFEVFRMVVALPNADIPGYGRINNNNDWLILLPLGIKGIKTGSNTPAGGTLSWAAYRTVDGEDRLILGTMLDQHVTGPDPNGANSLVLVQENSVKVIKAVRDALTSERALRKGQVVGHVDDGLGGRTPVVATRDLKVIGVPGQKLGLTFRADDKPVAVGAKAGTVVGELVLGGGGPEALRVPVALRSELPEPSLGTKLTRVG